MGLAGLTLVYKRVSEIYNFPSFISTIMMIYFYSDIFFVILYFYILKIVKHKNEIKKSFSSIQNQFFATSSISMLLLSMAYRHILLILLSQMFSYLVQFIYFFTFYTIKFWINNNLEIQPQILLGLFQ